MACVDIPTLPLQLLLRCEPEWRAQPVVVVDCDKPQGRILWANQKAHACRILPGMRYAAALSLCGGLRAAEVPQSNITRAVSAISSRLRQFTPHVEPARDAPGVFWLNASGLTPSAGASEAAKGTLQEAGYSWNPLYSSLLEWARLIERDLTRNERLEVTVVVGFNKFSTYAIAKHRQGIVVLQSEGEENAAAEAVPLERLAMAPAVRDILHKLGVQNVGDFTRLPAAGIKKRFGAEAWNLYRLASGNLSLPLAAEPAEAPLRSQLHLDHGETDVFRLITAIERLLESLLETLSHRDQAVAEIHLRLTFEGGGERQESLRPASATSDLVQLTELVRLRLENTRLADGVTEITITARAARTGREQLEFFAPKPPRRPQAAHRALARIRAEFGDGAVVRAQLREGHLPEALFFWEPLDHLPPATPSEVESTTLVRRVYTPALFLPARPRHEPDGWMLRGLDQGPVIRTSGPYTISGGWWRTTIHREYYFAETQNGDILWAYYDRLRRRWRLQGRVE